MQNSQAGTSVGLTEGVAVQHATWNPAADVSLSREPIQGP